MSTSLDAKLGERELVGEERRLARRGLVVADAYADLHRLLGHSAGDSKAARIRDLSEALEVGQSTIQNTLLRLTPFGDTILTAMYGEEYCGTLHPDWVAEPKDWGPITPWRCGKIVENQFLAANPPPAATEPEAAPPPPPAPIPAPATPAASTPAAPAADAAPVAPAPPATPEAGTARDAVAAAVAQAIEPIVTNPIAAAIDLLRDQCELAEKRLAANQAKVAEAKAGLAEAEAAVTKITTAIEVLEGLGA